jgi:PleD family two-component response regulator
MTDIKGKILVIDDHPFFGMNLRYKLEKLGYQVHTADSGLDGFIKAKSISPDIIIIDYLMPEMDGIQTCRKISEDEALKKCYLMMYTSESYTHIVAEAMKAGARDFIVKTTHITKIIEKIERVMEKKQNG